MAARGWSSAFACPAISVNFCVLSLTRSVPDPSSGLSELRAVSALGQTSVPGIVCLLDWHCEYRRTLPLSVFVFPGGDFGDPRRLS